MTEPDQLGIEWRVRGRRFRSWVPEEEEQYAFLVMWTPLRDRERQAFELFEGLDDLAGKLPLPVEEIASRMGLEAEQVRDLVRVARGKVERYYRANGLVIQRAKPASTAAALDNLKRKAAESRALADRRNDDPERRNECPAPRPGSENS